MIYNQESFDKKYQKKLKKVEFEDKKFEGQLIIEDYSELEDLYLQSVKSIEKIILRNLTQLQNCTIWDCNVKELVIENCPQIRKLDIRKNNLINLEFLKYLNNLENLEIDGNAKIISGLEYLPGNWKEFTYESIKLTEVLKLYGNNWKACKDDAQKIFNLSVKQDFQGLVKNFWELKQSREKLKKSIVDITSKEAQKKTTSQPIITKELIFNLNQEFQEKEEKINYLTSRVEELANSSKKQKEKIISSFLRLFSEKELAQQLVNLQLEFVKFKKQAIEQADYSKKKREYEKQLSELKDELWDKLNEEEMNKLEMILTDCEELVQQELELESRLNDKSSLITSQVKNAFSEEEKKILDKNNEIQQKQLEELKNLKVILEELRSSNQSPMSKLLNQLKEKTNLTAEELTTLDKIKELLEKKYNFLTARQETISDLQQCCDILESALIKGKYAKAEEATRVLTVIGKIANQWTFGIIEATGEVANLTNAHFKRLFTIKQGEQFQLTLQDEPEIQAMEQTHRELLVIFKEEMPLFANNDYQLYQVITNIWQNKAHIDAGDMKDAISLLTANLKLLKKEIREQEKELQKLDSSFKLEKLTNDSSTNNTQENKLQNDIQQQQKQLDDLVTSSKVKLVSKNFLNKEQKTQERQQLLQQLLTIQEKIIRLQFSLVSGDIFVLNNELRTVKEQLKKKLTITDFNELYRTQVELVKKQIDLERLQINQQEQQLQTEIQIPPKSN